MQTSARSTSPDSLREPRAFAPGGYEILDSRFTDTGEVMLWALTGTPPRRGELFTIERDDGLHDLTVVETTGHSPGWSALCKRIGGATA
jgi:glyoxylase-like metal-dependent hydrolase (beta-lactamase superfamily II)